MEGVMLQTHWGAFIALYLFLGGLGGGTLVISALAHLRFGEKMRKLARFGAWAGTLCLVVGVLLLLLDTTMPLRALMMWQSFSHLTSWMAIGAWLLFVSVIVAGVWALSLTDVVTAKAGALAKAVGPLSYAAIVLGACVMIYTGILLCVLEAHPLWNTFMLPVLFLVSAADTGIALVLIYVATRMKEDESATALKPLLEKGTLVLVVVEIVVLAVMMFMVSSGSEVGALSVSILTTGTLALPFWLLFVAVGLAAPLVVAVMQVMGKAGKLAWLPLAGAACCLAGGCALRFLILLAGIPVWM